MASRKRGGGAIRRSNCGVFLHRGIRYETPSDEGSQSGNAAEPHQKRPDDRDTIGRRLRDEVGIKGKLACSASMARSPLNLGLDLPEGILAVALVLFRDLGSVTERTRLRAHGGA